jgi:hypothetical protein
MKDTFLGKKDNTYHSPTGAILTLTSEMVVLKDIEWPTGSVDVKAAVEIVRFIL